MKIENLEVGKTYKNWKVLCEALEVEPKPSGKARKPQEKDFKQYFNWTKEGQQITITEIYSEIQEREDGRKKSTKIDSEVSLINKGIIRDNESNQKVLFSDSVVRSRLREEMELDIEESSLNIYENIINQIEGNSLRDLIAKSIINQLYLQLTQIGQVGFNDAWWVTDAELYRATGMISDSHYFAVRHPMRFCKEVKELEKDNYHEVVDHMKVNEEWLKKQRARVLKYLVEDLHLISHTSDAYRLVMRTTRIRNGVAYTYEEDFYPTLDELEWINTDVIPTVMRQYKDKNGKEYTSLNKIKNDGRIKEFYHDWLPNYINEIRPTGWGYVIGVYKCHRIGFSKEVIERAVNSNMRLLIQEKEILNEIADLTTDTIQTQVTNNRNEQSKKRHEQAVRGTSKCDDATKEVRSRESYIGVGYVVNRECHSSSATYTDFTNYNKSKTIVSTVKE